MASNKVLEKKKAVVEELVEKLQSAQSFVLADYRGLTVSQDTELRNSLRNANVEYKVYKNTLIKLALDKIGITGLEEHLKSPTAVAISTEDVVAPAKVLSEFAKKFDKLEIKVGAVEGNVIDQQGIKDLADLPSKEVLVAKVLGGLNAPIAGFVNVLNGNLRGLACVLNAIQEKKAKEA